MDGIHLNLPSPEIDDIIELLNIELDRRHLYVDLALISIVEKQYVCSDNNYCEIGRCLHDRIDWGGTMEINHMIY